MTMEQMERCQKAELLNWQKEEDEHLFRALSVIIQAKIEEMKAAGWIYVWDESGLGNPN